MEGRSYRCVLAVLTRLHHIVTVLLLYKMDWWGYCWVVDLSVAVRWMSFKAVRGVRGGVRGVRGGVRGVRGGVLYHWQSVAFPNGALLRPRLRNLLLCFSALVDLRR